ncbi:hypothetical protein CEUSTIGMA_g13128.t1 [Chlamydomonas eustigma]|uniref:DNA mismatch repair proteins mutS family domain-containing protein n=1 Tax=Chlamydomonas eustigma TaxID=1157962 RepID=A0A250XRN0_9CHLO|nr:hypothetical protein CEUSTIGMA_g13128.t1 [Chlamydomonas eustigma]|eukprot:GAX85714.1 hypothetical protein CEUSTIGMA_g13128.t1 [Chlamydomonas eustigma]
MSTQKRMRDRRLTPEEFSCFNAEKDKYRKQCEADAASGKECALIKMCGLYGVGSADWPVTEHYPNNPSALNPIKIHDGMKCSSAVFSSNKEFINGVNTTYTLDRTRTRAGAARFRKMLSSPLSDAGALRRRQDRLRSLQSLYGQAEPLLARLSELEADFDWLIATSPTEDPSLSSAYFSIWPLHHLNGRSPLCHDLACKHTMYVAPAISILTPLFAFLVPYLLLCVSARVRGGRAPLSLSTFARACMSNETRGRLALSIVMYVLNIVAAVHASVLLHRACDTARRRVAGAHGYLDAAGRLLCLMGGGSGPPEVDGKKGGWMDAGVALADAVNFDRAAASKLRSAVADADAAFAVCRVKADLGLCWPSYASDFALDLVGAWHPGIEEGVAVRNDWRVGRDVRKNALITGPNAGGKSTLMRTVLLAAGLAQTLCVAACESCTLSPFHAIEAHLSVVDAIGQRSLFEAEVERTRRIFENLDRCGGPALIAVDEMFSSTNPIEGAAAAVACCRRLASTRDAVVLVSTHYLDLCDLLSPDYDAVGVPVSLDDAGRVVGRPFRPVFGTACSQHVAIELLKRELGTAVHASAQEALQVLSHRKAGRAERDVADAGQGGGAAQEGAAARGPEGAAAVHDDVSPAETVQDDVVPAGREAGGGECGQAEGRVLPAGLRVPTDRPGAAEPLQERGHEGSAEAEVVRRHPRGRGQVAPPPGAAKRGVRVEARFQRGRQGLREEAVERAAVGLDQQEVALGDGGRGGDRRPQTGPQGQGRTDAGGADADVRPDERQEGLHDGEDRLREQGRQRVPDGGPRGVRHQLQRVSGLRRCLQAPASCNEHERLVEGRGTRQDPASAQEPVGAGRLLLLRRHRGDRGRRTGQEGVPRVRQPVEVAAVRPEQGPRGRGRVQGPQDRDRVAARAGRQGAAVQAGHGIRRRRRVLEHATAVVARVWRLQKVTAHIREQQGAERRKDVARAVRWNDGPRYVRDPPAHQARVQHVERPRRVHGERHGVTDRAVVGEPVVRKWRRRAGEVRRAHALAREHRARPVELEHPRAVLDAAHAFVRRSQGRRRSTAADRDAVQEAARKLPQRSEGVRDDHGGIRGGLEGRRQHRSTHVQGQGRQGGLVDLRTLQEHADAREGWQVDPTARDETEGPTRREPGRREPRGREPNVQARLDRKQAVRKHWPCVRRGDVRECLARNRPLPVKLHL